MENHHFQWGYTTSYIRVIAPPTSNHISFKKEEILGLSHGAFPHAVWR
jgi:hypothetical protein